MSEVALFLFDIEVLEERDPSVPTSSRINTTPPEPANSSVSAIHESTSKQTFARSNVASSP